MPALLISTSKPPGNSLSSLSAAACEQSPNKDLTGAQVDLSE